VLPTHTILKPKATGGRAIPLPPLCDCLAYNSTACGELLNWPINQLPGAKLFLNSWQFISQSINVHTLCHPKVQHTVHWSLPLVPHLSQISPDHILSSNFIKIHFSITLPCMPRSFKWTLFFRFSHQNPACIFFLPSKVLGNPKNIKHNSRFLEQSWYNSSDAHMCTQCYCAVIWQNSCILHRSQHQLLHSWSLLTICYSNPLVTSNKLREIPATNLQTSVTLISTVLVHKNYSSLNVHD